MAKLDATVLVFDVGSSSLERESKGSPTFYDLQQKCVEAIVLRKIFIKPQDEVSLFLSGTSGTDNDLNYNNISLAIPMGPMKWDVLKYVRGSIDPPNKDIDTDWLDALFVAMDYLRSNDVPKAQMKIVLFNTFTTPVRDSANVHAAIAGLKQLNIELIAISTNVCDEDEQDADQNLAPMRRIVEETDGILCSFDDIMPKLIVWEKKQKRRVAWKSDLEIGSKIRIKISAYIYMRNDNELPAWKQKEVTKVRVNIEPQNARAVPNAGQRALDITSPPKQGSIVQAQSTANAGLQPTAGTPAPQQGSIVQAQSAATAGLQPSAGISVSQQGSNIHPQSTATADLLPTAVTPSFQQESQVNTQTTRLDINIRPCQTKTEHYLHDKIIPLEDVEEKLMKAYWYGGSVVPFEDVQEYDNGGKGFRLIGFTKESSMQHEYFAGTGVWLVVAQEDRMSKAQLTALVQAIRNLKLAMIVRYTYSNTTAPKVMCLYPNTINTEHNSFFMYELFYKESFVDISFPRLKSKRTELSDEQYQAVDRFIDAMDLMGGMHENTVDVDGADKKPKEHFKHLLNPSLQHTYRALAQRHLNPDQPVLKMDDDLMGMLSTPKKQEAEPHVETLKKLFPLEAAKSSTKEAFFAKMRKIDDSGYTSISDSSSVSSGASSGGSKPHDIGTINPVDDFSKGMDANAPFHQLAKKMQEVIVKLIIHATDMSVPYQTKIHNSIAVYRTAAVEKAPYLYNEWMVELQKTMNERGKTYLWPQLVADKGFGLITSTESAVSTVSVEDAKRFDENKGEYLAGQGNNSEQDDGIDMEYNQQVEDAMRELF